MYTFLSVRGVKITAFCDTYKKGTDRTTGLPLISPRELADNHRDSTVLIGVHLRVYENEMRETLTDAGFTGTVVSIDELVPCHASEFVDIAAGGGR